MKITIKNFGFRFSAFSLLLIFLPAGASAAYEERSGECLRVLHQVLSKDRNTYQASADLLLNGGDGERNRLLSICHAFHDQPEILKEHVNGVINNSAKRSIQLKGLYNGTVFKTLPGSRTYNYPTGSNGNDGSVGGWASIGDFISVDNQDHLAYIVAFSSFLTGPNSLPGCRAAQGFYTYRATFLNVLGGWIMSACESNMDNPTFNACFPFLIVPCPSK